MLQKVKQAEIREIGSPFFVNRFSKTDYFKIERKSDLEPTYKTSNANSHNIS